MQAYEQKFGEGPPVRRRFGRATTGAGFGGCTVVLVAAYTRTIAESARRRLGEEGFEEPEFYEFRPAEGAEISG